jgi:hypothetical protein
MVEAVGNEQTQLTHSQLKKQNRQYKPTVKALMDATGMSFNEAGSMTGALSYSDARDWKSIMDAEDVGQAARLATRQAVEAGAFDRNAPGFRQPGFNSGSYGDSQMPAEGIMGVASVNRPSGGNPDYIQYHLMTPEGRRLTQLTGYNPELGYADQGENVQRILSQYGLDPATQAAYEDSMSYLVEGMDPSIYAGMSYDPSYDPADSAQQSREALGEAAYLEKQQSKAGIPVAAPAFSYTGTALPSSYSAPASSGVRPSISPLRSSILPREGIMSALLQEYIGR